MLCGIIVSIPYDKKIPWKKNPCFSYQIGLCPGVCAGVCDKKKYKNIIDRLITFLEGDGEKVRKDLEKDMKEFFADINIYIEKKDLSVNKMEMNEPSGDNTIITFLNKQFNINISDAVFTVK